ncbi:hypothetical protein C1I98_05825 [Spongiactinospora gelatinilytica]|uniref:Uncharacterized protein n=1 Tax=Spongiactinospora gelatinilytica TaxID=2666298 RepID=A0A2W2HRH4_9ACTN|nr:hypothetical protein [Spongiactinospora gelatinilytica]PZG53200.1 hypothetical protein C1I98_05825 [Spongiactinospora gelatinilytica]
MSTLALAGALQSPVKVSVDRIDLAAFIAALPVLTPGLHAGPPRHRPRHGPRHRSRGPSKADRGGIPRWPALPAADFLTFLAEARRLFPRRVFTGIEELYFTTAEQAPVALVSLRAVQAALFAEGYFLARDRPRLRRAPRPAPSP